MDRQEPSVVIPPEIVQLEQQLEKEIVQIENRILASGTTAWLRELWGFATALVVTTAGVALAGVVAVLFLYAFYIAAPLALAVVLLVLAKGVRRHRALAR